ncbi:MAG: amphi-Trp domain-containing protein [Candidatus Coatesbacteria bacterium]|jgi:amphi-Trp domain-containing protein|nr:amphi-Trp domain-containing protein [Candidatus Coatesbacteria bacterium]
MAKNEIEFKGSFTLEQFGEYMKKLTEGFTSGAVVIQKGQERVVLRPGTVVKVEVKAKQKEDGAKLELEVKWKQSDQPESLTISQFNATVIE